MATEPAALPAGDASPETKANGRHKLVTLLLAMFLSLFCLVSAGFLFVTELTQPRALWLKEIRQFTDGNLELGRSESGLSAEVASWFPSHGLIVRYGGCDAAVGDLLRGAKWREAQEQRERCSQLLLDALRTAPASPAVWLELARLRDVAGQPQEQILEALAASYRYGALEGWVISRRLPFVLRKWPALTEELQRAGEADLRVVLDSWPLLERLAASYAEQPTLRNRMVALIDRIADERQKSDFLHLAKLALEKQRASAQ